MTNLVTQLLSSTGEHGEMSHSPISQMSDLEQLSISKQTLLSKKQLSTVSEILHFVISTDRV